MTINLNDYTKYVVTGTLCSGGRFRLVHSDARYAFGINLWRGSVWGILKTTGKRRLLKSVYND